MSIEFKAIGRNFVYNLFASLGNESTLPLIFEKRTLAFLIDVNHWFIVDIAKGGI